MFIIALKTKFMMGFLRKVILGLFILLSFASCLNPRMVNKWVAKHYQEGVPEPARKKNEVISIYKNICMLNPRLPVNNFTTAVTAYSGRGLKQKLNGNHLELTIEEIPNVMILGDEGWAILFFGVESLTVGPAIRDMAVSGHL